MDYLILALATWRLTSLFVNEEGPFAVFDKLRCGIGVYDDDPNWLAKGLSCMWCASVWFGAGWALAYFVWKDVVWVALPLALSAGAIIIEAMQGR